MKYITLIGIAFDNSVNSIYRVKDTKTSQFKALGSEPLALSFQKGELFEKRKVKK